MPPTATMTGKRRLGPLIITNPNDSDSDSSDDVPPHPVVSPRGALDSIEPPAPLFGHPSRTQYVPADDFSGSSRSSPAPDTTPPPTPNQTNHPASLALLDDKGTHFHPQTSHLAPDRDTDSHGIGRAPHHIRRPSNDPSTDPVRVSAILLVLR